MLNLTLFILIDVIIIFVEEIQILLDRFYIIEGG